MKHIIFSTIYLLLSFSFLNAQQDNFKYYNDADYFGHSYGASTSADNANSLFWQFYQTPTSAQITDLQVIGFNAWATHTGMGVVYTTNAGTNWLAYSFNDTNFTTGFNGIYFLNNQTGWAVGGAVSIRKTTNGGLNWFRQIPPAIAGVLNSVFFFDANTGFALGRKGANYMSLILRSTNGGSNWTEIVASSSGENEISDQFWFNASTGWICGKSFLLKTTNGGLNFTDYYSSIPPTSNGVNALLCINFRDQNTGWIGGSNLDHKNIYKTTNGGLNWVFQDNPAAQNVYSQINDIKFIDYNTGWAAHGTPVSGVILYTYNGGTNWVNDNTTNTWYDCLWTYNDYIVYCGAAGGMVWYGYIPTGTKTINNFVPDKFELSQNFPNPFNPVTIIRFQIKDSRFVTLRIYDNLGREVENLVNEFRKAGTYEVKFDGSKLTSGIYFYRLNAGDFSETKKLMLVK